MLIPLAERFVALVIYNLTLRRAKMKTSDSFNINKEIEHFLSIWEQRPPAEFEIRHSKELWEERAHQWARELMEEDASRRTENRVQSAVRFIKNNGGLLERDKAIDIGCGPGRFVTEFAKSCQMATGTDISEEMLSYGKEYARSEGVLEKTSWIQCDFKRANIKELGWEKNFDLVFSSITPAIDGIGGIKNIINMSKRLCFNSCFIKSGGDLDQLIYKELTQKDAEPSFSTHLHWFYSLINLLILNGYLPKTEYFTETVPKKISPNEETSNYFASSFSKKLGVSQKEISPKILEILKSIADGRETIEYNHKCTYGFILWDVNR